MTATRPLSFLLSLAICLAVSPALAADEPEKQQAAWADLEQLTKDIKSKKSINEDLLQYLDAVGTHYKTTAGTAPPKPADDAAEEDKAAYAKAKTAFEKFQKEYRKKSLKQIIKAMGLVKLDRSERNIRDDVNVKSVQVLATFKEVLDEDGREKLSKRLIKELERIKKKAKHEVNPDFIEAAMTTLGQLGDLGTLGWMTEEFIHAKDNEADWLVGAHKAMILFKDVPGKMRYTICDEMIKLYAGVESQAERSSTDAKDIAKKRFWDKIKTDTVPVVQYYAGEPKNEDGAALAKMAEFQTWFREHKNARKAPWVDDKIVK